MKKDTLNHQANAKPVLAARAFVNIYEDTEGKFIGDAEWATWDEAYSERDDLSSHVETVEIVRRHGTQKEGPHEEKRKMKPK